MRGAPTADKLHNLDLGACLDAGGGPVVLADDRTVQFDGDALAIDAKLLKHIDNGGTVVDRPGFAIHGNLDLFSLFHCLSDRLRLH